MKRRLLWFRRRLPRFRTSSSKRTDSSQGTAPWPWAIFLNWIWNTLSALPCLKLTDINGIASYITNFMVCLAIKQNNFSCSSILHIHAHSNVLNLPNYGHMLSGNSIIFCHHWHWTCLSIYSPFLVNPECFSPHVCSLMDLTCLLSGTLASILVVTSTARVTSPCTYAWMVRTSSLLNLESWLSWVYPSWTKSMGNITPEKSPGSALTLAATNVKWLICPICRWSYLVVVAALVVFAGQCRWGWSNFIPLSIFRDSSSGYLVWSCCIVKAEITIIGSSSGGEVLADGQMNWQYPLHLDPVYSIRLSPICAVLIYDSIVVVVLWACDAFWW